MNKPTTPARTPEAKATKATTCSPAHLAASQHTAPGFAVLVAPTARSQPRRQTFPIYAASSRGTPAGTAILSHCGAFSPQTYPPGGSRRVFEMAGPRARLTRQIWREIQANALPWVFGAWGASPARIRRACHGPGGLGVPTTSDHAGDVATFPFSVVRQAWMTLRATPVFAHESVRSSAPVETQSRVALAYAAKPFLIRRLRQGTRHELGRVAETHALLGHIDAFTREVGGCWRRDPVTRPLLDGRLVWACSLDRLTCEHHARVEP